MQAFNALLLRKHCAGGGIYNTLLIFVTLVMVQFAIQASSCEAAERHSSDIAQYGLVVLVIAPTPGPAKVVMSFSRTLDHKELEQQLQQMADTERWRISSVSVTDEVTQDNGKLQTSVSFSADGIINWQSGFLGVEPIIRQFVNEGSIRVGFFVTGFDFKGPRNYILNDVEVKLRTTKRPGTAIDGYEYDARVAAWRLRHTDDSDRPKRHQALSFQTWLVIVTLFIIALAVGVVAGRLLYGRRKHTN